MIGTHKEIQHLRRWVFFINPSYKHLTPMESSTKMNPVRDYMFIENDITKKTNPIVQ